MDSTLSFSALEAVAIAVPVWSLVSHILIAVLAFPVQTLVQRSSYSKPINEFLCSLLWTSWSLECVVIGSTRSSPLALFTLFIRLMMVPYVFRGAYGNPCNVLHDHLSKGLNFRQQVIGICSYVGIQMAAMVCGVMYCTVMWSILGESMSLDHRKFLDTELDRFLQVPILIGFLLELFLSFAMYVPRLLMRESFYRVLAEALFVVFLVATFSGLTGAFMNPMVAVACNLAWSNHDLLDHVLVYWCGPLVGAALAVAVAKLQKSRESRLHSD